MSALNCKLCGKPKVVMLTKNGASYAGCPCQGKAVTGKPAPPPRDPKPAKQPATPAEADTTPPPKRKRFLFFGRE